MSVHVNVHFLILGLPILQKPQTVHYVLLTILFFKLLTILFTVLLTDVLSLSMYLLLCIVFWSPPPNCIVFIG